MLLLGKTTFEVYFLLGRRRRRCVYDAFLKGWNYYRLEAVFRLGLKLTLSFWGLLGLLLGLRFWLWLGLRFEVPDSFIDVLVEDGGDSHSRDEFGSILCHKSFER